MPIIIPANSAAAGLGYQVTNSLRFDGATNSDDCLIKTFGSGGDRKKWTYSVWFKMSGRGQGNNNALLIAGTSGQSEGNIKVAPDKIDWSEYNVSTGGNTGRLVTLQLLRDYSSWYHLVCVWDTANSTAGDRMIMYLNGSRITSLSTDTYPPINTDSQINNNGIVHNIARQSWNNSGEFNGYMSEICFIDGQALAPTSFGEFDEDSGIWKPKDDLADDLTFGDTGFYLEFKQSGTGTNSSGMGADTSGEDNHWAVNNLTAVNQTTDTCTNNFATLNLLNSTLNNTALSEGNLRMIGGNQSVNYSYITSTIAVLSGKWYWEVKAVDNAEIDQVGVAKMDLAQFSNIATSSGLQATTYGGKGVQMSNGYKVGDGSGGAYMGGFSANDICMVALDLDNNKITFGRNGQWANGSGSANQTYGNSTAAFTNLTAGALYAAALCMRDSAGNNPGTMEFNFGNPIFTGTDQADENSYGSFEYAPPTGFLSLCTINLSKEIS